MTQDWYEDWYKNMWIIYNSGWDKFMREYVFSPDPPFKITVKSTHTENNT